MTTKHVSVSIPIATDKLLEQLGVPHGEAVAVGHLADEGKNSSQNEGTETYLSGTRNGNGEVHTYRFTQYTAEYVHPTQHLVTVELKGDHYEIGADPGIVQR